MPFQIIRNDITKVKAEAIVNTANPEVMVGPGVDTAIYNAAGRDWLLNERAKIGDLEVGEVAVTPAGNLDAKFIFHESGPSWYDGKHHEAELLRQCYDKCLNLALQYKCESIAFPLLASGFYGFPKDISLRVAIDAFRSFLSEHELEIYLVVYDAQSVRLSESMFDGVRSFVDRNFNVVEPLLCAAPSINEAMAPDLCPTAFLDEDEIDEDEFDAAEYELKPPRDAKKRFNIPSFLKEKGASVERVGSAPISPAESRPVFSNAVPSKPLDVYVDRFENQEILTFGEYLQQLINKKGMTNKEVYFESNLTKQYFSKLINNKVNTPAKEKLLCIAVALKLNIDETKDFLLHAGYAISPYSKIDLVFEYYIRSGKYDIYEISFALEDLGIEGGLWPELA